MVDRISRNFEYLPNPGISPLSDCIRAGWVYLDETVDSMKGAIGQDSSLDRTISRAEQILWSGRDTVAYVRGIGTVVDISHDEDGNMMFLPNRGKVKTGLKNPR